MYRRIAVTLDATPECAAMAELAARLLPPGGRLDLVHLHDEAPRRTPSGARPAFGWEEMIAWDDGADEDAALGEAWALHALAARIGEATMVRTAAHVLRGDPVEELASFVRATEPDLIVAAERLGAGGGVPERLIRRSAPPLLLLREPMRRGSVRIGRILVPLDDTPFAATILPAVIELARATGADVSLLWTAPERLRARPSDAAGLDYLAGLREGFPADVRPSLRRPIHREPVTAILREAQCGYDLIAMATHGWGTGWEWVVGSNAAKILAVSRLPVLAYHPAPAIVHAMGEGALQLA